MFEAPKNSSPLDPHLANIPRFVVGWISFPPLHALSHFMVIWSLKRSKMPRMPHSLQASFICNKVIIWIPGCLIKSLIKAATFRCAISSPVLSALTTNPRDGRWWCEFSCKWKRTKQWIRFLRFRLLCKTPMHEQFIKFLRVFIPDSQQSMITYRKSALQGVADKVTVPPSSFLSWNRDQWPDARYSWQGVLLLNVSDSSWYKTHKVV